MSRMTSLLGLPLSVPDAAQPAGARSSRAAGLDGLENVPPAQDGHHLVAHLFLVGEAVSVFRALRRKQ